MNVSNIELFRQPALASTSGHPPNIDPLVIQWANIELVLACTIGLLTTYQ